MGAYANACSDWAGAMREWADAKTRKDTAAMSRAEGGIAEAFHRMGSAEISDDADRAAFRTHRALDRVNAAIEQAIERTAQACEGELTPAQKRSITEEVWGALFTS